jgi:uncharacterized protein (DUF983 family)
MRAIETGTGRCPKCARQAEYRFLDRGDALEYEVQCARCGNSYSEVIAVPATAA